MQMFVAALVIITLARHTESQGKTMYGKGGSNEKCPILDGIYVSVMRRIFNPGFHKEILSEVELMLTTTVLPDRCNLLIEETMPRGAYVDPDLVKENRHVTGLRTHIPAKVNIEAPEFESEAHRVFIFRHLDVQENLRVTAVTVPVNLRYHRPAPADSEGVVPPATVKILNPRLMISCEGEDLLLNCSSRRVTTYCDETGITKCDWLNVPYKINVPSVEVSVPVGNSDHAPLVVGVTTFITCGATIYILITMFREVSIKKD
jgi:hypothetical protein